MEDIFSKKLHLVIFDVDGTLYRQSKLKKVMLWKLFSYYAIRPWKGRELLVLYHFRKEREHRPGFSGKNLEEAQYQWCVQKTNVPVDEVKRIIGKWIFSAPNPYLKGSMYPGVKDFIERLKSKGIKTAVYSDYDSEEKMRSMGLDVDFQISSTHPKVNSFKPLPRGLLVVLEALGVKEKDECLFIGDRQELDGVCAENAGIPFLLVDHEEASEGLYVKLSAQL